MTAKADQKSYLQKYLGGPSTDKKKKKKKVVKGKGFKIIDDDLDLTKLRALDGNEIDVFDEGEDAPQIAGIIDDRPEELKKLDQLNTTSKWKVINQDDGFNSKLQIHEIKKDVKQAEKENELIFGKMYSDSEDEQKNDSDQSPSRKYQNNIKSSKKQNSDSDASPPRKDRRKNKPDTSPRKQKTTNRQHNNSDSDASPPRRGRDSLKRQSGNKNYDSDLSPPRKHDPQKKERKSRKPSRWGDADMKTIAYQSPKMSKKYRSLSPKKKRSSSSELSSPRKSKKMNNSYDSDLSPPRKGRKPSPRKRNKTPDSDISSPGKTNTLERHKSDEYRKDNKSIDKNFNRKRYDKHNNKYDNRQKSYQSHKSTTRDYNSDLSPPRRKRQKSNSPPRNKYKNDSSEYRSKRKHSVSVSPNRKDKNSEKDRYKRSSNSPPPSNKKMARTLEGKMAGLQNAVQLREENDNFRRKEDEAFKRLTDDVSGRNAQVVSRKGKRETSEERQKLKDKAERQKELDEKYKKWSKGVKQMEAQEARVQEFLHEASKPMARHKDDKDLEDRQRHVERDGDPMLQYMREKKRERGELGPEKPSYKGSFPPNRFNIRPGYRWDGVDRSNGYEKKYFDQQSKRKAQEEEAYKWSTEDL